MHLSLAEINRNKGATTKETKEKKTYFYNLFSEFVKEAEKKKVSNSNLVYLYIDIFTTIHTYL